MIIYHKRFSRRVVLIALTSILLACKGSTFVQQDAKQIASKLTQSSDECEFSQVVFKADFESARLDGCKQLNENTYLLEIDAESRPINPSPWYAFTVESVNDGAYNSVNNKNADAQKDISIILKTIDAQPRYLPKMQLANGDWKALDFKVNNDAANGNTMEFTLTLNKSSQSQPLKIAAQAIIDNQDYERFTNEFVQKGLYEKVLIGQSTQGRPIHALVNKHSDNHEWLVLIGRLHPPELTGAVAFLSFTEHLNHTTAQLNTFYERFNVLMVLNVNPDGVAHGNWRHNTKGVDLNRDWGKFTQVETKVVHDYLSSLLAPTAAPDAALVTAPTASPNKALVKAPKLVFAMDFHSTQQDIFYTMPNDYHIAPAYFVDNWLTAVKDNTVSSFVVRNRPGSSPGRGVFKQYIADTYNVHAVTYEMGDNTPNTMVKHVAQASASALVDIMLTTPAADFVYAPKQSDSVNN